MNAPPADDTRTLIDELLTEQQRLTPVERFSRRHADGNVPAQAKYYRDLIPLTKPQPGQQYAFEVHLDKCSGCKACVSACHRMNGLDDGEVWRDTGLLFSDDWRHPFQQTVTTACHHCADPACLNGCPVLAYDQDPVTGIVRHLDDQCIGCQYCVMKCPYDVPKYSTRRGIVRKCDMCAGRLAVDEAPACAQACPSEAIRITVVDRAEIAAHARRGTFLPTAPDPVYTLPTTQYKSLRPLPANLLAGDHARVTPASPHLPLVFMLVFSQLSVGAGVAAVFAEPARRLILVAAVMGLFAVGLASLHLGKPLKAWRAFLGWRKSWFSREVIVFSGYLLLAATLVLVLWSSVDPPIQERNVFILLLKISVAVAGLLGVGCSAMIYADTRREYWRGSQSSGKFFGTTVLLGAATALTIRATGPSAADPHINEFAGLMFMAMAAKLGFEHRIFRSLVHEETPAPTPLNKTARLLAGELSFAARVRVGCGVLGGLIFPVLLILIRAGGDAPARWLAPAGLVLCVAGELLERYLFFAAVAPAKMPGNVAA